MLPLSWRSQPAAEAKRIITRVSDEWITPTILSRRGLDSTDPQSSQMASCAPACLQSPPPPPPPPPPKVTHMSQLEFLDPIYCILTGFDCICTLILVFYNNAIFEARLWKYYKRLNVPYLALISSQSSEKYKSFQTALRRLLNSSSQGRILIGIIQLKKYFFFMGKKTKNKTGNPPYFNIHFWYCIP